MTVIKNNDKEFQATKEISWHHVHARCRKCKRYIGLHTDCGEIIFHQYDEHRWIVETDITFWPWFNNFVIVDEIFCICTNRVGFKLTNNHTEVLKSACELFN